MTSERITVREMDASDLGRVREVDRSEHVTLRFVREEASLRTEVVDWDVPRWLEQGPDDFSVRGLVDQWSPLLAEGGTLLGAFLGESLVGFAILRPELSPGVAELVALYVDRDARRKGVAGLLTEEVERRARRSGAGSLFVSATPSESAVEFYRSRGFGLARQVNEELAAREPEDIQMEKAL